MHSTGLDGGGPEGSEGRPGWDDYYLAGAAWASIRGDCRRSKVGAVIVHRNGGIVASGYNGVAPGRPGCLAGACPRGQATYSEIAKGSDYSNCIATHAEANAIKWVLDRGWHRHLRDATMYITRAPCQNCAELTRKNKIRRLVWPGGEHTWTDEELQ